MSNNKNAAKPRRPSIEAVVQAVQSGDCIGFCLDCGHEQDGCEPDARKYTCDSCGTKRVFGAEECLFIVGDQIDPGDDGDLAELIED